MSNNSVTIFNRMKNANQPNAVIKANENQLLFSMNKDSRPKKLDYTRMKDKISNYIYAPESVVQNPCVNFFIEKKNSDCLNEEVIRKVNPDSKFCSPKIAKKNILSSSSNLPTANNSFYTSPDDDKAFAVDEYQGLAANYSLRNQIGQSRKNSNNQTMNPPRKITDESEDGDFISVGSPNTSMTVNTKPKKSEDFKTKFKTEICKFWQLDKSCKFGDSCAFAHGSVDLRHKTIQTSAYRTRKCKQFYDNGFCPYGNRCQFAHNNRRNYFSYKKSLSLLSKGEKLETLKLSLANCLRLPCLVKISKSNDHNLNANFIDAIISMQEKLGSHNENSNDIYISQINDQVNDNHNLYWNSANNNRNRTRMFSY